MNTTTFSSVACRCGAVLALASAASFSPSLGASDRVSYTTSRPGNWDIYLFDRAGTAPRRLTTDPGLDYDAAVSPDGRWVVFTSERRGGPDLYALDLSGSQEPFLLIESDALEDQAAFSPDGASIAFVGTASGNADVYLLPFRPQQTSRMSDARNLTRHPGGDFRPAFSPDSRQLAFSSDRDLPVEAINPITRFRSGDIYLIDVMGNGLQRLTSTPGWDGSPDWSPDGKRIAFYSERNQSAQLPGISGEQPASIWIMNADGSRQRALTSAATTALSPAFLPDGRILFSRRPAIVASGTRRGAASAAALASMYEDGAWQIVSIAADGSNERIESDGSKQNYWEPTRGPSLGSFVVHGTTQSAIGSAARSDDPLAGGGSVLIEGAPFHTQLPDRVIDLYPLRYFSAALSPNENLVLYPSQSAPPAQLFASTIDGRNQRMLTHDGMPITLVVDFAGFRWSRDGQWIAFTQLAASGATAAPAPSATFEIWKARADGSERQNLTSGAPGYSGYPSFSADGKRIVFRRGTNPIANIDLYMMNDDGSNVRRLTNDAANDLFPSLSPTADQIAFLSNRADPQSSTYDVYLLDLNADGTPRSVRAVTTNTVQEGHLAFSYDGKWLIFASELGGLNDEEPLVRSVVFAPQSYGEMYAYRVEDGTLIRLTHNKWEEGVPSWEAAVSP